MTAPGSHRSTGEEEDAGKTAPRPSRGGADAVFAGIVCMACVGLVLLPTGFPTYDEPGLLRDRARVLEVDNSDVHQYGVVRAGIQRMTVEILGGPAVGRRAEIDNQLTGKMDLDEVYAPSSTILLEYRLGPGNDVLSATPRGRYRLRNEFVLLVLFAALLVALAGWTGLRALISFVFTALLIWKVMLPAMLRGVDPSMLALAVVAVLTAATTLLVGGLSRKGLTAFLGGFLGLALTAVLAHAFWRGFRVHGAVRPFSENLLNAGFGHLDLTRIFLAGIFVSASGAVMDLAMDIAAAIDELSRRRPDLHRGELVLSGIRVSRAVIGTMTTTLLLAYSGGYMCMLMFFVAQGIPVVDMLNHNYVAAEVLHTIVGSFGLVTVAPFTALVGGVVYGGSGKP